MMEPSSSQSGSPQLSPANHHRRRPSLELAGGGLRGRGAAYDDEGMYYDSEAIEAEEKESLYPAGSSPRQSHASLMGALLPQRRGLLSYVIILVALVSLIVVGSASRIKPSGQSWDVSRLLKKYKGPKQCDNPYALSGRMLTNLQDVDGNRWVPYDMTCVPPSLFASLRGTSRSTDSAGDLPLTWLHGRTVLLFGDHVERQHLFDFCVFAAGKFTVINRHHPLSPPPFENGIDEKLVKTVNDFDGGRPATCYIEEYDFMLVSAFHYGMANRVEFSHESLFDDQFFHPPVAVADRLTYIVQPLLASLNRPYPDLIQFSSAFWDLRHISLLDTLAGTDPEAPLPPSRLEWYAERLSASLVALGRTFPGTPMLWRSLHHPYKMDLTPFERVTALDSIGRTVMEEYNARREYSHATHMPKFSTNTSVPRPDRVQAPQDFSRMQDDEDSTQASFLKIVKARIGKGASSRIDKVILEGERDVGRRMGTRLGEIRINEWGTIMAGQEPQMNGFATAPIPGGYVWSDIILFELRRVVMHT